MTHKLHKKQHDYTRTKPISLTAGGLFFFDRKEVQLMTRDSTWFAMIEKLYGKEYAEKLLGEPESEEPDNDNSDKEADL